MHIRITDDLGLLVDVLPPAVAEALRKVNRSEELLEIVMDLGRTPEARFTTGEVTLSNQEVSETDIDYVVERIGEFGEDNRAGIPRTLHRISAIRNRRGRIVGLTCRVGRAVFGTVDIIRDIAETGKSLLLLGRPGVGKTTMLRELARILAERKRVVIVDTSNEIGGDGDIPHPAIGRSRRMQVASPLLQHEVMIEAVENHMPEVVVIDEIGRELETAAARTIAERGVQLVGTAHGNTLDNVMLNPTLADLVGGIQTVTLSDEEARRRGTQKSVLERKAPPTFEVVVEIQDWNHLAVHHDVAAAVDAILRGRPLPAEIRYRDESGELHRQEAVVTPPAVERARLPLTGERGRSPWSGERGRPAMPMERGRPVPADSGRPTVEAAFGDNGSRADGRQQASPINIYAYGVSQNRLRQAAASLQLPANLVDDVDEADAVLTLKSYYRKRPQPIAEAEQLGVPVYVLRSNTISQIESSLVDLFGLEARPDPFDLAMREAQQAIEQVVHGRREMVELSPQNAYVRRHQHELARSANLISQSRGKEPRRRVRIYRNTING